MDPFKSFVLDWLQRTGWSQARLAEASGMSQSLLSKYLRSGRRRVRPSPASLRRMSAVLGVPYEDLLRMCGYLDAASAPAEPADAVDREWAAMTSEVMQVLRRLPEARRESLLQALSVQVKSTVTMLDALHDLALGAEPSPTRRVRSLSNQRNAHRTTKPRPTPVAVLG